MKSFTRKIKVAVLVGGKSPEYEISLLSGREVVSNLNAYKYQVLPMIVSKDGLTWQITDKEKFLKNPPAVNQVKSLPKSGTGGQAKVKSLLNLNQAALVKDHGVDVVFIAMHGPYGEDGTIQGFLELIGIPYTGSGVLASALGMDKISSRKLFTQVRLTVPNYLILKKGVDAHIVWKKFKPPVFIKPSNQGSSIGASLVKTTNDLPQALEKAFGFSRFALVEEYLAGTEITGAILGNNRPQALPLVEIVPKKDFFDWQAKYDERLTDEIVPARLARKLTEKAQKTAVLAYQALGCRGFGRIDMIVKNDQIYVLEVNTIPGLTAVSLFPKAALAAGISYSVLLDKIISLALEG